MNMFYQLKKHETPKPADSICSITFQVFEALKAIAVTIESKIRGALPIQHALAFALSLLFIVQFSVPVTFNLYLDTSSHVFMISADLELIL